jgi:hypothetical protein
MSRHSVTVTPLIEVHKKVRKDLDGGHLGTRQIRKTTNTVTSPKLLKINACMASELGGKKYGSLGKIQAAFKTARGKCKS